jgi:hypothetical protein
MEAKNINKSWGERNFLKPKDIFLLVSFESLIPLSTHFLIRLGCVYVTKRWFIYFHRSLK